MKNKKTLIIICVIIVLLLLGVFLLLNNNKKKKHTDNLSSSYNKLILTGYSTYDIEDIKEGSKKEINTKDIIDNKEFASCEGKLVIVREGENVYNYLVESSCKDDNSNSKNTAKYTNVIGEVDEIYNLQDSLVISTLKESEWEDNILISNNLTINYLDKNGDLVWKKDIDLSTKEDKTINYVSDSKKINNKLYVFISSSNDYTSLEYLYIYDLDGTLIKKEIMDSNNNNLPISQIEYIGSWNNKYYYAANGEYAFLNDNILEVDEKGYRLTSDNFNEDIEEKAMTEYMFEMGIIDGKIYSISEDEEKTTLYISDLTGKKEKEEVILNNPYVTDGGLLVTPNNLFVKFYNDEKEDGDVYLNKYDKNLKLKKEKINYKSLTNLNYLEFYDAIVCDNKLVITLDKIDDDDTKYVEVLDEDLNYLFGNFVIDEELTEYGMFPLYRGLLGDYVINVMGGLYKDDLTVISFIK